MADIKEKGAEAPLFSHDLVSSVEQSYCCSAPDLRQFGQAQFDNFFFSFSDLLDDLVH